MKAVIEIKKGESPYQAVRSEWLKDSQGDVLFKFLSKKMANGQIEGVVVVERRGHKTVLGRTTCEEEKFPDAIAAFRQMVWKQFPQANLAVEDIEPVNTDDPNSTRQYTALKATRLNIFWLRLKKILRLS